MLQTPAEFNITAHTAPYPLADMRRFRWHTGATLRPLHAEESCPVLFRDIGPQAMALFLRGQLRRLAGPLTPITYARTADYIEPYTDFGRIGRLVFLRPLDLHPWHSGQEHIFVAPAEFTGTLGTIGFAPPHVSLAELAAIANGVASVTEWRDALGNSDFDDVAADTLARLDALNADLIATEAFAEPLRIRLQSGRADDRAKLRERLAAHDIGESELCAAWHHLPDERREHLRCALPALHAEIESCR